MIKNYILILNRHIFFESFLTNQSQKLNEKKVVFHNIINFVFGYKIYLQECTIDFDIYSVNVVLSIEKCIFFVCSNFLENSINNRVLYYKPWIEVSQS